MGVDVSFTALKPDDPDSRFQSLRRELGIKGFGLNLITLQAGQRGRVHAHERQEEVYLVLEGELTLLLPDGDEHALRGGQLARVGATVRRQLANRGPERVVMLALGSSGEHEGRDGRAWESFDEPGEGRRPQDVALPADLAPGG